MSGIFAFNGFKGAKGGVWGGIEVDVGADKEIAVLAVYAVDGAAKLVVNATSLIDDTPSGITPGAQFGTDSSYTLVSVCREGWATTFANPGDCYEIEQDEHIEFPIPLIVPAGRSFHVLNSIVNDGSTFSMIFEERALGAAAYLPKRGG